MVEDLNDEEALSQDDIFLVQVHKIGLILLAR